MDRELIVELIGSLESEINNGGFDQFFFNSPGNRTGEIVEALIAIGANHTAGIVKRAAGKFPAGFAPSNRKERQIQLLQISPDADAFELEDDAFLKYVDDLSGLVASYQ